MSLEEKIGQMVQIDWSMANADVMKSFFIGKNHFFFIYLFIFYDMSKLARHMNSLTRHLTGASNIDERNVQFDS